MDFSPRLIARVTGGFYLVTVITSLLAFSIARGTHVGNALNLTAGAAYIVVTVLLYELLKPVNRTLSLLAAAFSLVGISHADNSLFFFGFYCILLGYLIVKSTFLPRAIGIMMALAGLGLLSNTLAKLLAPALAHSISPFGFTLDGIGEIGLTLWLLIIGLDAKKWAERARSASGLAVLGVHSAKLE